MPAEFDPNVTNLSTLPVLARTISVAVDLNDPLNELSHHRRIGPAEPLGSRVRIRCGSIAIRFAMRRADACATSAARVHACECARTRAHTEALDPPTRRAHSWPRWPLSVSPILRRESKSRRWRRVCAPPCLSLSLSLSLSCPPDCVSLVPVSFSLARVHCHSIPTTRRHDPPFFWTRAPSLVAPLVSEFPTLDARDGATNFTPRASNRRSKHRLASRRESQRVPAPESTRNYRVRFDINVSDYR